MQVDVKRVEGSKSKYFNGFYLLPSWIHAGNENWVPWFLGDIKELVDKKHPLFEHTSGEFLVATRDDKVDEERSFLLLRFDRRPRGG